MATITKTDLETADYIEDSQLPAPASVSGSDISAPNPTDLTEPTIANKLLSKTLSIGQLPSISIAAANSFDSAYQTVGTDEEISADTLNRTASSLKDSVNGNMEALRAEVEDKLRTMSTKINEILTDYNTAVNGAFAGNLNEWGQQLTEIQRVIHLATEALNNGFKEVRDNNIEQNKDIASVLNTKISEVYGLIKVLQGGVNRAQDELKAIKDFYYDTEEIVEKVRVMNEFLTSIHRTDVDLVAVVNRIMNELERMAIVESKTYWVNSADGKAEIMFQNIGWGEFANTSDFTIMVQSLLPGTKAIVENVATDKVNIAIVSDGKHYLPQPVDCSAIAGGVPVSMTLVHKRRSFATMGVSLMNDSFIADGQAIEHSKVVGGLTLSANTVSVAKDGTVDVTVSDEYGTVSVTSGNEDVATAIYDADSKTITIEGVGAGSTIIAVQDGNSTANIEVTVTE